MEEALDLSFGRLLIMMTHTLYNCDRGTHNTTWRAAVNRPML